MHVTLFGILYSTIKMKVYATFWGLMNLATKSTRAGYMMNPFRVHLVLKDQGCNSD